MPLGIALNAIRSLKNSLQGFLLMLGGKYGYTELPLRTSGLQISNTYDIDTNNNIYFSQSDGKIYKIFSDTKEIIHFFGTGSRNINKILISSDGDISTGNISNVVKILIKNTDIYFLENNISIYKIRKISNGLLSTIGSIGSSRTLVVSDFVIDSKGDFFITFYENSLDTLGQSDTHCIYKVYGDKSKSPEIFIGSTIGLNDYNPVQSPVYSGSDYTRFCKPSNIEIDSDDNLYIYDSGNKYIKKITPTKDLTRHKQIGEVIIRGYTIDAENYLYVLYRIVNSSQETLIKIDTKTPARSDNRFDLAYQKNNTGFIDPFDSDNTYLAQRGFIKDFKILKDGNGYFVEDVSQNVSGSLYNQQLVKFNFNDYSTKKLFNGEILFNNPVYSDASNKKYANSLSTGSVLGICFNSNNDLIFSDETTHTIRKITSDNSKVILIGGNVLLSGLYDGITGKRGTMGYFYKNMFWTGDSLLVTDIPSSGATAQGIRNLSFINNTVTTVYQNIYNTTDICKDKLGNLFILTAYDGIYKIDTSGNISIFSPIAGTIMVIDGFNNLFVYKYVGGTEVFIIYKITPDGTSSKFKTKSQFTSYVITTIEAMCINSSNTIYINNSQNKIIQIIPSGVDSIFYSTAGLITTTAMCVDTSDNLYVGDLSTKDILKITPGKYISYVGYGGSTYGYPRSFAYDPISNDIYTFTANSQIWKTNLNNKISNKFCNFNVSYSRKDGLLNTSLYNKPKGICSDNNGNIYVCDYTNNKIRKITPQGVTSTIADISYPRAITIDSQGNLFVSRSNITSVTAGIRVIVTVFAVIYKIIPSTGIVSVFAGNEAGYRVPDYGPASGIGTNARFSDIFSICIDPNDNLYVGDEYTIRKITANAEVSLLAGIYGMQGDTEGVSPKMGKIYGLAYHPSNKIYFIDNTYGKLKVLDLSTNAVSVVAGSTNSATREGLSKNCTIKNPQAISINTKNEIIITTEDFRFVKYSI